MSLNSDNSDEVEKQNLYQLLSMKVEGVIFLANILSEHEDVMRRYRENDIKIVTMEGYIEGTDSVVSDARSGVRQAMDYLVEMGHTRIGACHGARRSMPVQNAYEGDEKASSGAGSSIRHQVRIFW